MIGFQYKTFKFIADLLMDKESKELAWFIYPYKKEFKDNILVFSDIIKVNRMYQRNIYNLTFKNERIERILSTFREGNIFYSDDLTGTDFKQCIDFTINR